MGDYYRPYGISLHLPDRDDGEKGCFAPFSMETGFSWKFKMLSDRIFHFIPISVDDDILADGEPYPDENRRELNGRHI